MLQRNSWQIRQIRQSMAIDEVRDPLSVIID